MKGGKGKGGEGQGRRESRGEVDSGAQLEQGRRLAKAGPGTVCLNSIVCKRNGDS